MGAALPLAAAAAEAGEGDRPLPFGPPFVFG
jgi:hypothetical protein